jgi:ubiquinol-cytochrome c reductase cytochrome b subunit
MNKLLKRNPLTAIANEFAIDSPLPSNINYLYNFGSILALILGIQIVTGISLAMHHTPSISNAFNSVEHIMRDVNNGWLMRYAHANGASLFSMAVYIHIGRGIYHGSYTKPRILLRNVGVIIYFIMMGTAFLGYVSPWGQMSFWAATVITNTSSSIPYLGTDPVYYVRGSFSVDNATLNRFFALHFTLPFILAALIFIHSPPSHQHGSNNPLGISSNIDKSPSHPYYTYKDYFGFILFGIVFAIIVFYYPNLLGHPDNYIEANPLVTPTHIVPEWYLSPPYAVLRSITSKGLGVLAMVAAILLSLTLPFTNFTIVRSTTSRVIRRIIIWLFFVNFILSGRIGGNPAEYPYIVIGQILTTSHFTSIVVLFPIISSLDTFLHYIPPRN